MLKKKILCYFLLNSMLVSMFAAGEVSVAAEQQRKETNPNVRIT